MKKAEIIEKLTNDISRYAYRAIITEHLKNIGYDMDMMEYHSTLEYGKAFEAMELLDFFTESGKGDKVFEAVHNDAMETIQATSDRYGVTRKYYISLLNEAGFDGLAHYKMTAKFDSNLPQ